MTAIRSRISACCTSAVATTIVTLVGYANVEEMYFGSSITLVVVSGLEVTVRTIEVECIEFLEPLAIDANAKDIFLISNFIGKPLAYWYIANLESVLVASSAAVDSHCKFAFGAVVKFANGFRGDGAINMNLAHHNPVIRNLFDGKVPKEPVGG